MIEALREWLGGIVATAALLYLVRCLVPQSAVRRAADLTGGLVLLVSMLQPLMGWLPGSFEMELDDWKQEVEALQAEWEEQQQQELSAVIAEETAAYISHEADALGLDLEIAVETECGAEGIAIPCAVTVRGEYSEALSVRIAQELGIPQERQVWHE